MTDEPRPIQERWLQFAADQLRLRPVVDEPDPIDETWRERRWAHIPNRFRWARLADVDDTELADRLKTWASTDGPLPNVVLYGATGNGKTFAAIAAARLRFEAGDEIQFWPVVELLDKLRPSGDPDIYEAALYDADLLVLDDLGASRDTDWTDERLYAIVNRRWLDERPIIVTTNIHPRDMPTRLGDRMASRLLGGALHYGLGGRDRRLHP